MMSLHEERCTDSSSWIVGPYHSILPGQFTAPMKIKLNLDGEEISSCKIETGFTHRGLEKSFERQFWLAGISYSDHLDFEGAIFSELAFCMAVEELAQIEVTQRAKEIRIILSEFSRVSAHLGYMARVAQNLGASTFVHYVLRDREKILDLFELLTGARFSLNFLRFGGVCADVSDGFVERVVEVCDLLRIRLKEYNDLFTFNHAFLRRSGKIGVIDSVQAQAHGITGPALRAAGISFDVRKAHPYSGYDRFDFLVPVGNSEASGLMGDAHERFIVRLKEITQSLGLLKQIAENMSSGTFVDARAVLQTPDFIPFSGEAYSRVETSRGLLGCHVVSDGMKNPARVQFSPPSLPLLSVVPEVLQGALVDDFSLIMASLDICVSEVDR